VHIAAAVALVLSLWAKITTSNQPREWAAFALLSYPKIASYYYSSSILPIGSLYTHIMEWNGLSERIAFFLSLSLSLSLFICEVYWKVARKLPCGHCLGWESSGDNIENVCVWPSKIFFLFVNRATCLTTMHHHPSRSLLQKSTHNLHCDRYYQTTSLLLFMMIYE